MSNINKITFVIINIFLLNILLSCDINSSNINCSSSKTNISVTLEKLASSPYILEVNNSNFQLNVYLSKNFSRTLSYGRKSDNSCLTADVSLITVSGKTLPSSYKINRLWLINDKDIWETKSGTYPVQKPQSFYGGPSSWQEDSYYYAVVQITNDKGNILFIRSNVLSIITTM